MNGQKVCQSDFYWALQVFYEFESRTALEATKPIQSTCQTATPAAPTIAIGNNNNNSNKQTNQKTQQIVQYLTTNQ